MRRRQCLAAAAGGIASLVSGCLVGLGTGGGVGDDADVEMSTNAFVPGTLEVTTGETVVWENTSSRAHTVTAYEDSLPEGATYFASGDYATEAAAREAWDDTLGGGLDPGDTFEHSFEVPGEYPYLCIPHVSRGMTGKIVVD